MDERIRVLVVDHHTMFAEGLRHALAGEPGIDVVGPFDSVAAARLPRRVADVVLLGADHPDGEAARAVARIRAALPGAKVILLTDGGSPRGVAEALAAGACGFVRRNQPVEDLAGLVRRAVRGEVVMAAADLPRLLEAIQGPLHVVPAEVALARLTPREAEILRALAGGASAQEVADLLGISRLTVESHVKSILAKLGVHSKIEAVTLAWRHGLAPVSRTA
ncbi:MAG TPA: response regulator transcription factor [Actinomycetota bacterium]|nr:response regulator transcription factor [Actinomycetota bacterium]